MEQLIEDRAEASPALVSQMSRKATRRSLNAEPAGGSRPATRSRARSARRRGRLEGTLPITDLLRPLQGFLRIEATTNDARTFFDEAALPAEAASSPT